MICISASEQPHIPSKKEIAAQEKRKSQLFYLCELYQFFETIYRVTKTIFLQKKCLHPWTEVVYQNLESKNALFYIFDSTASVFENSEKPLF